MDDKNTNPSTAPNPLIKKKWYIQGQIYFWSWFFLLIFLGESFDDPAFIKSGGLLMGFSFGSILTHIGITIAEDVKVRKTLIYTGIFINITVLAIWVYHRFLA